MIGVQVNEVVHVQLEYVEESEAFCISNVNMYINRKFLRNIYLPEFYP